MKVELEVDTRHAVGPLTEMYGHGPVTIIGEDDPVFVCFDCGYTTHDNRLFAHKECDREKNPITQTWRERLEAVGAADLFPEPDTDGELPADAR